MRDRGKIACVILALLTLTTLVVMYAKPVEDGDLWFHMAYGRYMMQNHTLVPDHTIYSWTPASGDEIYCAWIPQILFHVLHQAGGLPALFLLRYLCLLFFLVFAAIFAWKNNVFWHPLTWLICLMGVLMSQSGALIKAELFSYVLMVCGAYVWWSLKSHSRSNYRLCYLFPVIMLIWINSHGGVIFGMTFLGAILLGEGLNGLVSRGEVLSPEVRKHFFAALLLCGFATLVSPYGWEYPAQLVQNFLMHPQGKIDDFMTQGAYQSIFHPQASPLRFTEYLVVAVVLLAMLFWPKLRERRIDWSLVLVNLVFFLLYMRFIRVTYFWAIIFAFSALHLLAGTQIQGGRSLFSPRCLRAAVLLACLFFSGRSLYEAACRPLFGFWVNYVNPVEEAEFIRNSLAGLRLGNDYESGSYLLWALGPERKVFIDSRYFPYKAWYDEYTRFRGGNDVDSFLSRYPCDGWCLTYDFPGLAFFVRSPEWSLVHYGPSACLFVRKDIPLQIQGKKSNIQVSRLNVYQAYRILDFALKVGDLETARDIYTGVMKKSHMCGQKEALAVQSGMGLAEALEKRGLTGASLELYREAARRSPEKPDAFVRMGNLLMKKGDLNEAAEQYHKALIIDPESIEVLHGLSIIYSGRGEYALALECLQKMLVLQPENSEIYYNISCIHAKKSEIEESLSWLGKAIDKGFHDWALLKADPDMTNIRGTRYYRELMSYH